MHSDYKTLPIMLVDDEPEALSLLHSILTSSGYQNVVPFQSSLAAKDFFDRHEAAAVVLDLRMPGMNGQDLLEHISTRTPRVPAIVVTAENQLETAIDCMRSGAVDYLVKPVTLHRVITAISSALEMHSLDEEIRTPIAEGSHPYPQISSIKTNNKDMQSQLRYVDIVSKSNQPILIIGETGVGKELFAHAVHTMSKRTGQFVTVNVAGLDDLMFSDTLFGHRKGAYTGAMHDRDGLIKKASKGTLFLDEIGDLNEMSQIKLLRLIQENEYYPLGSDNQLPSTARLVLATNQNLKQRMHEGKFRKDLYYRLCTHQVTIPPLRERFDDIPILLDHFIRKAAKAMGRKPMQYRKELIGLLCSHNFPGNVRELQAIVHDVVARTTTGKISIESFREILNRERDPACHLPAQGGHGDRDGFHSVHFPSFPTLKQAEAELIRRALEIAAGNQGAAAQMLGVTRQALNNRLRREKKNF